MIMISLMILGIIGITSLVMLIASKLAGNTKKDEDMSKKQAPPRETPKPPIGEPKPPKK